jgi:hypothetical protein
MGFKILLGTVNSDRGRQIGRTYQRVDSAREALFRAYVGRWDQGVPVDPPAALLLIERRPGRQDCLVGRIWDDRCYPE